MGWIRDLFDLSKEVPTAAVLSEHLDYLQRKYDDLETERDDLVEQVDQLKKENTELQAKAEPAPGQPEDLVITDELAQMLQQVNRLDEVLAEDIAVSLKINKARAEYYLKKLLEHNYLRDAWYPPGQHFMLNQRGREYLIEAGYI